MEKIVRSLRAGRPAGATSYDKEIALAFGAVVRERRLKNDLPQDELASRSDVDRSHISKIERGSNLPTLPVIFKISKGLECEPGTLVQEAFSRLSTVQK
jgi:transcriptional regulator with XRE-family HTH domain